MRQYLSKMEKAQSVNGSKQGCSLKFAIFNPAAVGPPSAEV